MHIDFHQIIGKRDYMEDRLLMNDHIAVICDGHAGKQMAEKVIEWLKENYMMLVPTGEKSPVDHAKLLQETIVTMDLNLTDEIHDDSGCTMCLLVLDKIDNLVYIVNVGDSRCVFFINGTHSVYKLDEKQNTVLHACSNLFPDVFVTTDHTIEHEFDNIHDLGGKVVEKRLHGEINMGRSLGDYQLKKPPSTGLSCIPDVYITPIDNIKSRLMMCSDGMFEATSLRTVCDLLKKPTSTPQDFTEQAYVKDETSDNTSVLLIQL